MFGSSPIEMPVDPTPRMTGWKTPMLRLPMNPGTTWVNERTVETSAAESESPVIAVTATATSCRRSSRRVAVTMMSEIPELDRSEEHTSELQSLMRTSYAVFCLKKKKQCTQPDHT